MHPETEELLDDRPDRRPASRWWWALVPVAVVVLVVAVVHAGGNGRPRADTTPTPSGPVIPSFVAVTPAPDPAQTRIPGGCPAGQRCAGVAATRTERTSISAAATAAFGHVDHLTIRTTVLVVDAGAARVLFSRIVTGTVPGGGRLWVLASQSEDDSSQQMGSSVPGALAVADGFEQGFYVHGRVRGPGAAAAEKGLERLVRDQRLVTGPS